MKNQEECVVVVQEGQGGQEGQGEILVELIKPGELEGLEEIGETEE